MPTDPQKKSGATQAIVKVEKLTQIAFALPVAAVVGWLAGSGLDKLLHQHWIWVVGLILGVVAGFVMVFRMIAAPGTLAATAYDFNANKGPGFREPDERKDKQ